MQRGIFNSEGLNLAARANGGQLFSWWNGDVPAWTSVRL